MRVNLYRSLLLVAAVGLVPAVAAAKDEKSENKDPNRVICEKQEVLGSRLGTKRVCLTAAEWAHRRREDRQTIDRSQAATASRPGG